MRTRIAVKSESAASSNVYVTAPSVRDHEKLGVVSRVELPFAGRVRLGVSGGPSDWAEASAKMSRVSPSDARNIGASPRAIRDNRGKRRRIRHSSGYRTAQR